MRGGALMPINTAAGDGEPARTFPLATWAQARREIAAQARRLPRARRQGLLAVLLLAMGSWCTVSVPRLLGRIVDIVSGTGSEADLWGTAGLMVAVAVIAGVCNGAGYFLLDRKSTRLNSSHVRKSRMPSSA